MLRSEILLILVTTQAEESQKVDRDFEQILKMAVLVDRTKLSNRI